MNASILKKFIREKGIALQDPKLDLVRDPFLEDLSRMCLLIALGQFICIPALYIMFAATENMQVVQNYITAILLCGFTLIAIAFLCRFGNFRKVLGHVAYLLVFSQAIYFYVTFESISHPLVMIFPILTYLSAPIYGTRGIVITTLASFLTVVVLHFNLYPDSHLTSQKDTSLLFLISFMICFSGYISRVLWIGVLKRETNLRSALQDVQQKADEMEGWVERLGKASSEINSGNSTQIPEPGPYQVFSQLTQNLGEMQSKLKDYFATQLLKDRLSSTGILATGMAHELNTPLTTMKFLIEQEKDLPIDLKNELSSHLTRMGLITQSILHYGVQADKELIEINDVIKNSFQYLERLIPNRIELDIDCTDSELPILGIANQIQQVIINLVKNSIDAIEENDHPRIRITTSKNKRNTATLTVEDNGQGIEEAHLKNILEPFYSTKSPNRGTGLGLFIVHQILEKHKASINIRSSKVSGTKILIHFPLAQEIPQQKVA